MVRIMEALKQPIESGLEARIAGLATRCAQVVPLRASDTAHIEPLAPNANQEAASDDRLSATCSELIGLLDEEVSPEQRAVLSRRQLAKIVGTTVDAYLMRHATSLGKYTHRVLVTNIMQGLLAPRGDELTSSNPRT